MVEILRWIILATRVFIFLCLVALIIMPIMFILSGECDNGMAIIKILGCICAIILAFFLEKILLKKFYES